MHKREKEREREREREGYIYIYIYIERERKRGGSVPKLITNVLSVVRLGSIQYSMRRLIIIF
jgi:hypothetical protein